MKVYTAYECMAFDDKNEMRSRCLVKTEAAAKIWLEEKKRDRGLVGFYKKGNFIKNGSSFIPLQPKLF